MWFISTRQSPRHTDAVPQVWSLIFRRALPIPPEIPGPASDYVTGENEGPRECRRPLATAPKAPDPGSSELRESGVKKSQQNQPKDEVLALEKASHPAPW